MSILIKGVDMPNNCLECFLFKSNMSGHWFCRAKRVAFGKEDAEWLPLATPNWCPLVEIKTPHGRLVDIDNMVNDYWDGNSMEISKYDLSVIGTIIEAEE